MKEFVSFKPPPEAFYDSCAVESGGALYNWLQLFPPKTDAAIFACVLQEFRLNSLGGIIMGMLPFLCLFCPQISSDVLNLLFVTPQVRHPNQDTT